MADSRHFQSNGILARLPADELAALSDRADVVELETRQTAYEAGKPIEFLYFPLDAVFSVVSVTEERIRIEVATIGREGMVGLPVFLGTSTSPQTCFCQVSGPSVRLPAGELGDLLRVDGMLHRLLNRFAQATMVQIAQNVVCNNAHSTEQRAARWLLTTHDRVRRDRFPLTQDFLAQMLGARRPTVSTIAARLAREGLIQYRRGTVTVADRPGLERTTCNCYWIVRAEFDAMSPLD